ncbi:uncharacterized protein LOC122637897 isoform X3 [Vespula pensylvanica]|uniref:uncharacterized protein LOC122637897 isoform X3 n=1 Tax=Vespula pensylvanica TaxID=30213 RepID=UPI001CBA2AE7|nr:uncharacterized protein LOC122637897 isoform X3 [Vespula pensylvanica]
MSNESNLTWRVNGQDERGFHSNEHHQPNSTDVEMFPLNSTLESNSRATKEERQQASRDLWIERNDREFAIEGRRACTRAGNALRTFREDLLGGKRDRVEDRSK